MGPGFETNVVTKAPGVGSLPQDSIPSLTMGHWSGYLFLSLRVVLLAHGPDGQASPRDGTSPRRDERSKPRAIVALCWVAETPDEGSCRRYSQNLALA
jgi:hypothetical protein